MPVAILLRISAFRANQSESTMTTESTEATKPVLINPLQLWTDLGLRALESSVASTQKMGDTLDRMTRASASADFKDAAQPSASRADLELDSAPGSAPGSAIALVGQLHRSAFEAMQQGWLQWMSKLGTLASVTAGSGSLPATGDQPPALQPPTARPARRQSGNDTEGRAESRAAEHAHAAADAPRRTRRTAAKRPPRSGNR